MDALSIEELEEWDRFDAWAQQKVCRHKFVVEGRVTSDSGTVYEVWHCAKCDAVSFQPARKGE